MESKHAWKDCESGVTSFSALYEHAFLMFSTIEVSKNVSEMLRCAVGNKTKLTVYLGEKPQQ